MPAALLPGLKVECELGFRLNRAISNADADLADALSFHPAIELSASRYAPGTGNRAATTFDGIADNGTGGAAVFGAAVAAWARDGVLGRCPRLLRGPAEPGP